MNLPKSSWRTLKAGLIYLLCFVLEWILGTDPRTLGDAPFGRIAALLLEAVIMLIAMILSVGNATLQHAPDSRLDDPDGPGGVRDIVTCGDLCPVAVRAVAERVSGKLCDGPRCHFTADVPAVCRTADARRAVHTRSCWANLLSPPAPRRRLLVRYLNLAPSSANAGPGSLKGSSQ